MQICIYIFNMCVLYYCFNIDAFFLLRNLWAFTEFAFGVLKFHPKYLRTKHPLAANVIRIYLLSIDPHKGVQIG